MVNIKHNLTLSVKFEVHISHRFGANGSYKLTQFCSPHLRREGHEHRDQHCAQGVKRLSHS